MTNSFIAYTRVSTQRQGENGVSLSEQRRAIDIYAHRRRVQVIDWFEERTAAGVVGRPVFKGVLRRLEADAGRTGLLLHKIDRGARNLRDWADIGELLDQGIEVRFAHDDLDLWTRGGRLTADIQAVIATDYIRNLREEVRKGNNGRLRQGLYPFKAPSGYIDCGAGTVKRPDPAVAPLIVLAFQLYATGAYSLNSLVTELATRGFKTNPSCLSRILRNPFYKGTIKVRGRLYEGKHLPLVSADLFDRVQRILDQRRPKKRVKHRFRYAQCLECKACGRCLTGERQKGRVYYRCHGCRGVCVREDRVLDQNRLFRLSSDSRLSNYGQLEPWEKFESLKGIVPTALKRESRPSV